MSRYAPLTGDNLSLTSKHFPERRGEPHGDTYTEPCSDTQEPPIRQPSATIQALTLCGNDLHRRKHPSCRVPEGVGGAAVKRGGMDPFQPLDIHRHIARPARLDPKLSPTRLPQPSSYHLFTADSATGHRCSRVDVSRCRWWLTAWDERLSQLRW